MAAEELKGFEATAWWGAVRAGRPAAGRRREAERRGANDGRGSGAVSRPAARGVGVQTAGEPVGASLRGFPARRKLPSGAAPCTTPAFPSSEPKRAQMKLNDEEQAMLWPASGAGWRRSRSEHQIKVGDFFEVTDFVAVTRASIMADTESLGEAGVALARSEWRHEDSGRGRVRVPTITDPRGADFAKAGGAGVRPEMLDAREAPRSMRSSAISVSSMTDTCINYQTIQAPVRGEHVAFGDTGVVIYISNSICKILAPLRRSAWRL